MKIPGRVDQAADAAAWDGFAAWMVRTKFTGAHTPLREYLERDGKRHVNRMHPPRR